MMRNDENNNNNIKLVKYYTAASRSTFPLLGDAYHVSIYIIHIYMSEICVRRVFNPQAFVIVIVNVGASWTSFKMLK